MRVRHVPHDYRHGSTFLEEKILASGGSGGGEARKLRATLCIVQLQEHRHRHICATILWYIVACVRLCALKEHVPVHLASKDHWFRAY